MLQKKVLRLYAGLLSCFLSTFLGGHGIAEGTLINTSYGNVPVEWLGKDDLVVSRDKTDETFVLKPVLACTKRAVSELIELSIGDTSLLVDPAQRFFVLAEHKWYAAKDLKPGQQLSKRKGGAATVSGVKRIKKNTHVYELSIQDCHNFCVSDQEIIAHNVVVFLAGAALGWCWGAITATATTAVAGASSVAAAVGLTTATSATGIAITGSSAAFANTIGIGVTGAVLIKGGSELVSNAGTIMSAVGSVGSFVGKSAKFIGSSIVGLWGGGKPTPPSFIRQPGLFLPPDAKSLSGVSVVPLGCGNNSNIAFDALGRNLLNTISSVSPKTSPTSTPVKTIPVPSIRDRFANPQSFIYSDVPPICPDINISDLHTPATNPRKEMIDRWIPNYDQLSPKQKELAVLKAQYLQQEADSIEASFNAAQALKNLQALSPKKITPPPSNNVPIPIVDNHNAGNNGESKTQSGKGSPHPDQKKQVEPKKTITCAAGAGGMPPDDQWNQHNLNNPNDKSGPKIKPRTEPKWEKPYIPQATNFVDVQTEVVSKFISDVDKSTAAPFVCTFDPKGAKNVCCDKIAGIQWHEGKVVLRVDFDEAKGAHFNLSDCRSGKKVKLAVPLEGGEAAVAEFLVLLNNPETITAALEMYKKKVADETFRKSHPQKVDQYTEWIKVLQEALGIK